MAIQKIWSFLTTAGLTAWWWHKLRWEERTLEVYQGDQLEKQDGPVLTTGVCTEKNVFGSLTLENRDETRIHAAISSLH